MFLILLFVSVGAVFGQQAISSFIYPYQLLNKSNNVNTNAAILDDFDGDGDLDIIITNTPHIEWLENDGTGQFPSQIIFTEGTNFWPQDIARCDCDNDGDSDYVIASGRGSGGSLPGQLLWLQRQPDGTFIHWTVEAGDDFDRVDVADFNNDGLQDIVAVGFSQSSVSIYLNDGFLNFTEQVIAENVIQVDLVEADDIDGNGNVDVIFGGSTSMLMRNLGDAVFDTGQELYTWSDSIDNFNSGLAIADLNNDGFRDILTFSGHGSGGLYFLDGANNFDQSVIEKDGTDVGGDILVADIDGNGRQDIIRQSTNHDYLSVLYQNDDMIFTRQIIEHNWDNRGPAVMASGDLDADSDLDLVFPENGNVDEDISWYENIDGQLYGHYLTMQLSNLYMTKLADLDGDGDLDVLATTGENIVPENELLWFENRGAAGFVNWRIDDQVSATNLAVADIDGNNSLDVIVSASDDNSLFWYRKNGLTWDKNVIEANGNLPFAITTADMEPDGDIDIALTSQGDDKVFWYMNDGSGNFTRRVVDPNLSFPRQIEAADLDDDGDTDLAVAVPNVNNSVVIYLNDGNELFTKETVLTGYIAADLEIGDWNNDGSLDILASFGGNPDSYEDVGLLQNDGQANFTASTLVTDYGSTVSLKLIDVDADNDLDLILGKISPVDNGLCFFDPTCFPIPPLKIVFNENGATSSQDLLDAIDANITVWGLDAGDIDQDGVIDIVAAENIQGNLYLFTAEPYVEPPPTPPPSTVITPAGGVFAPTSDRTFTFPSGAFSEPVTVTYKVIDSIPHTLADAGVFYELTAVSTTTNQPVQLEPGQTFTAVVQYDEANLPPGVSESSLGLYYTVSSPAQQPSSVTATWNPASSNAVNTETNEITAVDSHLGTWGVFGSAAGHELFLPAVVKP